MPDRWKRYRSLSLRRPDYDYAQAGAYFVTICAQDCLCLFGEVVDEDIQSNASGEMIFGWWRELPGKFPYVEADDVVIMPNHVHGVFLVNHQSDIPEPPAERAALGVIVGWFKTMTTNAYIRGVRTSGWQPFNRQLWQRNYFEHIIRNERAHDRIRQYIYSNPSRWPVDDENPERFRQG